MENFSGHNRERTFACLDCDCKFFYNAELTKHVEDIHVNPSAQNRRQATITRIDGPHIFSTEADRIAYRSRHLGRVNGKTPLEAALRALCKVRVELGNRSMEDFVKYLYATMYVGYSNRTREKRKFEMFDYFARKDCMVLKLDSELFSPWKAKTKLKFWSVVLYEADGPCGLHMRMVETHQHVMLWHLWDALRLNK